jgi:hypothetical protein
MGLFGSSEITTVGTQVARVIDNNMVPSALKQGAIHALMDHSSQTTEYVMEELVAGLATKMDRLYRYGRDKYTFGLPSGNSYSSVTGKDVVEHAIEVEVGPVDSITYYQLGPVNLLHLGWLKLVRDHAYDSRDNSLMVDGKKVYLSNMQPVVVQASVGEIANGSMDVWAPAPNAGYSPDRKLINTQSLKVPPAFIIDATAMEDYIKVTYCWEESTDKVVDGVTITSTVARTATLSLSTSDVSTEASYFQVRYLQGTRAGYWMYQLNSGVNPTIEAIFDTAPTTAGSFFPWGYFRYNKHKSNTDKYSQEYLTTKKMLKLIGMDYDKVADSINENPDIGDVEQALLMAAVPAKTENEVERKYLFDFFTKMFISASAHDGATEQKESPDIRRQLGQPLNKTTIIMRDQRFKMALSFSHIIKHRVSGNIGKIGHHASEVTVGSHTEKVTDATGVEVPWTTSVPTHYYRRQISENVYEELAVTNLKMMYWVWGDYTTTADESDDILLVPLDYSIVSSYQLFEKEELYARSLHYIFNSRVVTKLKWYQTGVFRVVLVIVAVVITIISYGATIQGLVSAIAAGGAAATAAYYAIAVFIIKYIAVSIAIHLFVKVVGARIAFITAIVAAVFGMYQIAQAGSVEGAPWAAELVNVSTGLSKEVVKELGMEFNALRADAEAFEKYKDTQTHLLEKAQDLLDGNVHLDPIIIWGETPDELYQRTVHSGNIGIVGIEAVSSFVETRLTLPKLTDTLGELYV